MANGYCPTLLRHILDIANGNAPGKKMHIAGALAMLFCCQNSTVSPVNDGFEGAHQRGLAVTYRRRPTEADVDDEDNCDVDRIPAKLEWNLPNMMYRKTSWFLSDEEITKYCREASNMRSLGTGRPTIMQEHYDLLLEHANILMRSINKAVVTQLATSFGGNVTISGASTGKVININRNGDQLILDNGIIDMMRDLQENEMCQDPCIVGGGMFASWNIARTMACCNAAGIDLSKTGMPRFFFDKDTQQIWGQDSVGVFAPGSVKFIGRNLYVGEAFSGQRGNSFFTTIPMPVSAFECNADDCLRDLLFDLQVRYIDCPTTIEVDGGPQSVNRGWQFILSKRFALWAQPDDAYADGDDLEGTNGILKYFFTNTTSGDASGPYGG